MKPVADSVVPSSAAGYPGDLEPEGDAELTRGANRAQRRLEATIDALRERGELVASEVRAAGLPARALGAAIVAGLAAVALASVIRSIGRRRREARRRRVLVAGGALVRRSLIREIGSRLVLGAAGVVGARVASEVVLPAALRLAEDAARARLHGRADVRRARREQPADVRREDDEVRAQDAREPEGGEQPPTRVRRRPRSASPTR